MADWATIADFATAGGTLVLAAATFASVRSANHAARTAEHSFEVGLRPLLFPSRLEDPDQKIRWGDDHWARLEGGKATLELADGVIYLALSLRNVGAGIAVIHAWRIDRWHRRIPEPGRTEEGAGVTEDAPDPDRFRAQTRDLYVPPGDMGFWQGAIRDDRDPMRPVAQTAVENRTEMVVDVLYGDHEGGQRTVTRFLLSSDDRARFWLVSALRHWNLDRPDPRS